MGVIKRQSIKGTIVNYVGAAIGMFTTFFILTKYLSPEVIGLTRTLIDAGILLAGLAQIGTNSSILRFYPYFKDAENKDNGFFFWTLIIPIIGFSIYILVFLIFKNYLSNFFFEQSELFVNYFYIIIPLGFFILYQTVFETNSIVLHRIVVPIFVREVGIRLMILLSYFLYAYHYLSITGLVIAICCTYGIAAIINLIYLFYLGRISLKPNFKHITKPLRRNFFFYTLFLMGSALTLTVMPSLATFFVAAKLGLAFAGIYTIARYIVAFIEIPYRSLGSISNPHLSQSLKDNDLKATNGLVKKISLHQFLIGSAIFFVVWTNIDLIFQIIPNGKDYLSGKWVVFILGLFTLMNTSLTVGGVVLNYSRYYYYSLIFTFILVTGGITLNALCIPAFGINGAALATISSYTIYYILLLSLVNWKVKVNSFSLEQLKALTIILFLFVLDYLWKQSVTIFIMQYVKPTLGVSFVEALLRTIVLGGIGFLSVYYWHISEEVDVLIKKYILK